MPLHADERQDTRQKFVELDSEIQAIKEEILAINQEILLLEEASLYPYGEQLVVLVSMDGGKSDGPASITLALDGQTVVRHDYSRSEQESMRSGGVHRLYTATPGEGSYELAVSVSVPGTKDKVLRQQRSITLNQKPGKKYLELRLAKGQRKSQPKLTINEWL